MPPQDRNGFTLLELIIVIIIVGVLASLALPRFMRTVEFSRSAEAVENLRAIRNGIERCRIMSAGNTNSCFCTSNMGTELPWDKLFLDNLDSTPNAHFYYRMGSCGAVNYGYTIHAYRNTIEASMVPGNSFVTLSYSEITGPSIVGSGAYVTINQ